MTDESPPIRAVSAFGPVESADEPTLTIAAQGTGFLAVTVSRRFSNALHVNDRKVAVVEGGSELVIEAPAEAEIVAITAELVTDHA